MTTTDLILIAIDLAAAVLLSLGVYYPRHRRRDLVVAFIGVNVGVLAVASALSSAAAAGGAGVAAGLGLGLFGVLSIIRLRSSEISQREVSYYFAALAMGLIGGLGATSIVLPALLIALIVLVMWVADHPALFGRSRHQLVRLDRAIANEAGLENQYIGRVDIRDDHSLIDLPEGMPREILSHLKTVRVVGQQLQIRPDGSPFAGGAPEGRDKPRKKGKLGKPVRKT